LLYVCETSVYTTRMWQTYTQTDRQTDTRRRQFNRSPYRSIIRPIAHPTRLRMASRDKKAIFYHRYYYYYSPYLRMTGNTDRRITEFGLLRPLSEVIRSVECSSDLTYVHLQSCIRVRESHYSCRRGWRRSVSRQFGLHVRMLMTAGVVAWPLPTADRSLYSRLRRLPRRFIRRATIYQSLFTAKAPA